MSQRRATIIRSVITGNLANDDGGGVYARRGGIQVYDSILSANLVDGSGGALGSTGDILVVRSHVDGNTTDGDGGAIYTDEDGDVTVIDSTVNGSTADGPGGAIFTLDGDVTDHQLDARRQPRRRPRRRDLGRGGGDRRSTRRSRATWPSRTSAAACGRAGTCTSPTRRSPTTTPRARAAACSPRASVTLVNSTVATTSPRSAANVGAGRAARGLRLGDRAGEGRRPRRRRAADRRQLRDAHRGSLGYNVVTDASCGLSGPGDLIGVRRDGCCGAGRLAASRVAGSPAIDRIPLAACAAAPPAPALEGEQHLAGLVTTGALLTADQRGVPRPQGGGLRRRRGRGAG